MRPNYLLRSLSLATLPLLVIACSSSPESTGQPVGPVLENGSLGSGTRVEVVDLDNGVAVDFTTTEDVVALRAAVRRMAEAHTTMPGQGGGMMTGGHDMSGGHGQGGGMGSGHEGCPGHASMDSVGCGMPSGCTGGAGMTHMPAVKTSVGDIEGGARMSMIPVNARDLEALRSHVREKMDGRCPMSGK